MAMCLVQNNKPPKATHHFPPFMIFFNIKKTVLLKDSKKLKREHGVWKKMDRKGRYGILLLHSY